MKKRGLLGLLLAGVLALSACSGSVADEAIMKIDGQDILKSEYMVYLYTTTQNFISVGGEDVWTMDFEGQTADELLQERTIETLRTVIAAGKYAAENDVVLTDEMKTQTEQAAESFFTQLSVEDAKKMNVDKKKLIPYMEASYLYSLAYEALAKECEVDEAGKEAYLAENQARIGTAYTKIAIDSILVDDEATAKEASDKIKAGETFADVFAQYDVERDAEDLEDRTKTTLYQTQFLTSFGLEDVPAVGQVTEPILNGGKYFIVLVEGVTEPTEDEVKSISDQEYISMLQTQYCEGRLAELVAMQKVELVDAVLEGVESFH